jgi:uncharacterized protein YbcC (UPF0753/DUF2309 family)
MRTPGTSMTANEPDREALRRQLAVAAAVLPRQGPIGSFVALNPLAGFEAQPFIEAVEAAATLHDAEPYLPESTYRQALATGRITAADIDAVLTDELGSRADTPLAGGRLRVLDMQRVLLVKGLRHESDAAVRWTLTESAAIDRLRDDLDDVTRARLLAAAGPGVTGHDAEHAVANDLWHACVEATAGGRAVLVHTQPPVRPRDLIVAVRPDLDLDDLVHPPLIRFVAAFLDQGVADWPMPDREAGLLGTAASIFGTFGPREPWAAGLGVRFREIAARLEQATDRNAVACDVIAEELAGLAVQPESWGEVITRSLVALRGWAGMIRQLEQRPDLAPLVRVPARLADFLAVRLVFDHAAARWAARRLGGPPVERGMAPDLAVLWSELRDRHPPRRGPGSLSRALLLHQFAQLTGLTPADLRSLSPDDVVALERGIHAFDSVTRRRLLHLAYERRFGVPVLDALTALPVDTACDSTPSAARPRAQVVCCVDDRCESLRRHLEEIDPAIETLGAAGFFSVAMNYRGIDDWHATPLCPIVVRPEHTISEVPEEEDRSQHRSRQVARRRLGRLRELVHSGTRTLFVGGLLTSVGGAVAAVPLVSRVVFPRLTTLLTRAAAGWGRQPVRTRLELRRLTQTPAADGTRAGFDPDEMAAIVRRLLEDIGLTRGFARLVVLLGHGSSSLNNPHESAYDCGACGGGRGGPNARAFALMANDPEVRTRLAEAGLVIPDDVVFLGGMLDTCSDHIEWYDLEQVPEGHRADVATLRGTCHVARARDAHERCRRFEGVPSGADPDEALRAVEARAADLAQVRPEYGHATTALCIVGRRHRTRGLFLDRRAFLMSYDAAADADDAILARTLGAVVPVCSGISLAYTFSRIDPRCYGAGTKLPHNITGLIGVMDGHSSDLRTGLPLQGVEIHEPVRLLVIIETTPERLRGVLAGLPAVDSLVRNGWVRVACWPPDRSVPLVYLPAQDHFVPEATTLPVVSRSADWYGHSRKTLPPALIRPRSPTAEAAS